MQETRVQSLGQEDPLEEEMVTHSSILAWEMHGQKSLVGYSPWGLRESITSSGACGFQNFGGLRLQPFFHF